MEGENVQDTIILEEVIVTCNVCDSIKRNNHWYKVGKEFIDSIAYDVKLSHTACSPPCMSKGYGISLEQAQQIYDSIEQEQKY